MKKLKENFQKYGKCEMSNNHKLSYKEKMQRSAE